MNLEYKKKLLEKLRGMTDIRKHSHKIKLFIHYMK